MLAKIKLEIANKLNFDDLYNTFLSLQRRQQAILSTVLVVLILLVFTFPIYFLSSLLNQKELEYQKYLDEASQLKGKVQQINLIQGGVSSQARGGSNSSDVLRTAIYNVANKVGMQSNKISTKSSKSKLDSDLLEEVAKSVSIKNVAFDILIRFIHTLETYESAPIKIKKVILRSDKRDRSLIKRAELLVTTIKAKSK